MEGVSDELAAEAHEVAEALGRALVDVEAAMRAGKSDPQLLSAMFRSAHTLKGIANMMGSAAMVRLTHVVEDTLDALRMGRIVSSATLLAALLRAVEQCERLIDVAYEGGDEASCEAAVHESIQRLLALESAPAAHNAAPAPLAAARGALARDPQSLALAAGLSPAEVALLSDFELFRLSEAVRAGQAVLLGRASFALSTCAVDMAALDAALTPLGEIIARVPATETQAQDDQLIFDYVLASSQPAGTLQHAADSLAIGWSVSVPQHPDVEGVAFGADGAAPAEVSTLATPESNEAEPLTFDEPSHRTTTGAASRAKRSPKEAPALPAAPAQQPAAAAAPPSRPPGPVEEAPAQRAAVHQLVRVDVQRLDQLLHASSELSRTREVLQRVSRSLRERRELRTLASELEREDRQLERRLADLRNGILATRMVPIERCFARLVRAGLKIAAELELDVAIDVTGAETKLDKLVVDELVEPLLHLVRNAVDHAIERPEVREHAGKPKGGRIQLRAEARGSHVLVEVEDDGCGVDVAAVAREAIAKQLITAARAATLSERDALRLLWLPGFSTRREVSEYSGRGIGLDVVRTRVEALGGSVELSTRPGRGSTFSLMAPITLSTLPSVVVRSERGAFALPVAHVVETVALHHEQMVPVQGRPTLSLRGEWVPLVALSAWVEALGHEHAAEATLRVALKEKPFAVVVAVAGRRLAIAVRGIIGRHDLLTKTLGSRLRHLVGIAGAAELPNRELSLVLDVPTLIDTYFAGRVASGAQAAPLAAATPIGAMQTRLQEPS